jgi:lipid-binding SYLF domain-containing protein
MYVKARWYTARSEMLEIPFGGLNRMHISKLVVVGALAVAPMMMLADEEKAVERLDRAAEVVHDMMRMDDKGVPQDLIDHAQCVVVVPGLKKAGFIVGAKFGRGFVMCRRHEGQPGWTGPAAIRIEGGSVGFQIGASEQDIILIVKNREGERKLLQDKFTLGGEATVAAGPVGRDASAQTDAQMNAEILSYSRSRGLFAGIALQGATLRPDHDVDRELYGQDLGSKEILMGNVHAPAAAARLEGLLDRNSMHKQGD